MDTKHPTIRSNERMLRGDLEPIPVGPA